MDHLQQKATSLLELILVLAVLALLSSGGYLSARYLKHAKELKQTSAEIILLINNGIVRSRHKGKPVTLRFSKNVYQDDKLVHQLPNSVSVASARFASINNTPDTLKIWPSGITSNGTIELRSSAQRICRLFVSIRGAIREQCNY